MVLSSGCPPRGEAPCAGREGAAGTARLGLTVEDLARELEQRVLSISSASTTRDHRTAALETLDTDRRCEDERHAKKAAGATKRIAFIEQKFSYRVSFRVENLDCVLNLGRLTPEITEQLRSKHQVCRLDTSAGALHRSRQISRA
jgi:hypothetical protein